MVKGQYICLALINLTLMVMYHR